MNMMTYESLIFMLLCVTVVYLVGLWTGYKTGMTSRTQGITTIVTEAVVDDLINNGYLKTREDIVNGERVVTIVKYDEENNQQENYDTTSEG